MLFDALDADMLRFATTFVLDFGLELDEGFVCFGLGVGMMTGPPSFRLIPSHSSGRRAAKLNVMRMSPVVVWHDQLTTA